MGPVTGLGAALARLSAPDATTRARTLDRMIGVRARYCSAD
ncbi:MULTISPECIES: hypothetical protein [Streptomyces]|nr:MULTISPECIES: hypothetical protein [Streptomyces]